MSGVRIDSWPVWSDIRGGDYVPWKEIDRICSYMPDNAMYSKAFQQHHWDGIIHLYRNGRFPTGLVFRVTELLRKHNIPYEIITHYEFPEKKYPWFLNPDVRFRDKHLQAVTVMDFFKRGMMQLPTRFGKTTVVASATIAAFGVPTLFIAHQLDLIYDAKNVFSKFIDGVDDIGVIGGGSCTYRPLTVACIDSLAARLKDYTMQKYLNEKVKYVIVDETQYYGPGQYKDVLNCCPAPYRLFMSATAERNDGADLELEAASGPLIFSLNEEEMIREGYISDVSLEMVPFDHKLFNEKATGINYQEFYKMAIVENMERNQLIIDEVKNLLSSGNPTIVIVKAIDHGKILKEMLQNQGVPHVEFIWGEVDALERINVRNAFNEGKYDVLIGSTIFDTAIDLRRASGLVLAASGSSKIRAPQRVGRVLSQVMGKTALVRDIKDMNVKYFADDAKDRQKVYIQRYGDKRVSVRGSGPKTDIEKMLGLDYSQMFDNLF